MQKYNAEEVFITQITPESVDTPFYKKPIF